LAGGVNLYSYAGNNPVAFSDPFGLCLEDLCIGEAVVLSSLGVAAVRAIGNLFMHRPVLENVGRDGSRALSVASLAAPVVPSATRVAGAVIEARAAERAGEVGSVRVASRLEANAAARIWAGTGGRQLTSSRAGSAGTEVVGRASADGSRVARWVTMKANGLPAANLQNTITGSNMHVVVQP
jgi:hypothetical protein